MASDSIEPAGQVEPGDDCVSPWLARPGRPGRRNAPTCTAGLRCLLLLLLLGGVVAIYWIVRTARTDVSSSLLTARLFDQRGAERARQGYAPPDADAAPFCAPGQRPEFVLGFAALEQQLGPTMGEPVECEHADPDGGAVLQRTTTGLAVYDGRTNLASFTDGWRSWALTPRGLVAWEGGGAPPQAPDAPQGHPSPGEDPARR